MNSRTASELNMYQKVLSLIVTNLFFFTGFIPLEELIATFTTGVDDLEKLLQITKKDTSGLTDEKQNLRGALGELALTSKTHVKGILTPNQIGLSYTF